MDGELGDFDSRVSKLKTVTECEIFAKNALSKGRADLARQARERSLQIRAEAHGAISPVEKECLQAVYAYEEVLSERAGRRQTASRTWPMIERYSILPAVERIVCRPDDAAGFKALIEMGLLHHAFESVVLRHPDAFSAEAAQRSRARLAAMA